MGQICISVNRVNGKSYMQVTKFSQQNQKCASQNPNQKALTYAFGVREVVHNFPHTPYAAITQVQSRAPDDGHINTRNMLSRF